MPHLRKQRRRNGPPATGRQTTDSEKCADRRQRLHRSCFSKKGTPAYGARHHARPCDRLKNNSPQTAGDAFGTDPTVGHRTKLIINYGKNDLPTRKKMRCTPPTAAPAPRQSGQSDHRQPLAPAARQNPEPGFFRSTAGRSPADTCRMAATGTQGLPQPPATTSGAQRPPGDSGHYRPSTSQKRAGRWIFSTSRARAKSGAICAGVNPAMPQPISVTRKVISGCCRANRMKSST